VNFFPPRPQIAVQTGSKLQREFVRLVAFVEGDGHQPGVKAELPAESIPVLQSAQKGLLGNILGVIWVARNIRSATL